MATVEQIARRAEGVLQHPVGQRVNERGLFGQRNELGRRDGAELGMLPAEQGLGALADPRLQVDARLEDKAELVWRRESGGQIGEDAEGATMSGVAAIVVERHSLFTATAVLGGDQRGAQHFGRIESRAAERHQPDADLAADRDVIDRDIARKGLGDLGRERRHAGLGIVLDDEGEAQDRDVIDGQVLGQQLPQANEPGADEVLGKGVTERTQDLVVMTRVGQGHQHKHPVLASAAAQPLEIVKELQPVGEARDVIVAADELERGTIERRLGARRRSNERSRKGTGRGQAIRLTLKWSRYCASRPFKGC